MKQKPEKLFVTDLRDINSNPAHAFRVTKAVNTTAYKMDQLVSEKKIDDEIAYNPNMTVTISPRK
jgi:hypothetical protein